MAAPSPMAASDLKHLGISVALDGHGVTCPKCGGAFPLLACGPRAHHGRLVEYRGDKTGCGSTVVGA